MLLFSGGKLDRGIDVECGKGEEIREARIGAIRKTSNCLVFGKGEVFRERSEPFWIATVREYRIKTT